jgi:glutamate racemase
MIGIFDSSFGGLLLARALRQQMPAYDLLFWGDVCNGPYDDNSLDIARLRIKHFGPLLIDRGVQILLLACPTASCAAQAYVATDNDIPIIDCMASTVKDAVQKSKQKRFGILGPRSSAGSGVWEAAIDPLVPGARVDKAAAPLLGPLVEEAWHHKPEARMILKKYLHPLKMRKVDTLILADCRYYLLQPLIQKKMGRHVSIIEACSAIIGRLKDFLAVNSHIDKQLPKNSHAQFWVNDARAGMQSICRMLYGTHLHIELFKAHP